PFPNSLCLGPSPFTARALAPVGNSWLVLVGSNNQGADLVGVLDVRAMWTPRFSAGVAFYCNSLSGNPCDIDRQFPLPVQNGFGPCVVCPGAKLADFVAVEEGTDVAIDVRCADLAGKTTRLERVAGGAGTSCTTQTLPIRSDLLKG